MGAQPGDRTLECRYFCVEGGGREDPFHVFRQDRGDRLPTTVENRCLRTLEISFHADCSPFLGSLVLPKLREFCLLCPMPSGIGGREAFLAFLTRSNCKLNKLVLRRCAFEPFIECLEQESFKSIQQLKIWSSPKLTNDELIRLTVSSSSPAPRVLLPKLTHLKLRWCLCASAGMLAEMVLSRRRQWDGHIEPLQWLHVMDDQLYEMDIRPIEDGVLLEDDFGAGFDMKYLINKNGERISIRNWEGFKAFDG